MLVLELDDAVEWGSPEPPPRVGWSLLVLQAWGCELSGALASPLWFGGLLRGALACDFCRFLLVKIDKNDTGGIHR